MTTVGSTGAGREGRDVVLAFEPETAATLRTRGRAYFLCEVDPPSQRGRDIAAEVVETARHDYYYDLSAGNEVALRRALRKANRQAAQLVRELRGRTALHAACAVIVNNELYAARVGRAQVFLVRHARLFLPGDEPNELADFVHRTTTRQASSLGSEPDLLPLVWRQTIEAGDTIILASGSIVDALGADALKNAAITLHPRAAAEHIKNRSVAEDVGGSHAVIFLEIAAASGAAARLAAGPESAPAQEVVIAENIRSRIDPIWRRRPRLGAVLAAIAAPIGRAVVSAVAVVLELMPRRRPELPRRQESARSRQMRLQRITSLLAAALLLITVGIGAVVVNDYQENQIVNEFRIAVVSVETDIASSRSFADREDTERAWERLEAASKRLEDAAGSPAADEVRVEELRREIRSLEDRLNSVIFDLAAVDPGAAPVRLTQTPNGLYAADPGSGKLWRIFGEPVTARVVLERGRDQVGTPLTVVAQEEALLTVDDGRVVWRAEGNALDRIDLPGTETWKGVTDLATFVGNIYILDGPSGQLWRYEPDFQDELQGPVAFLPEPLPAGSPRAVAVDGDIWILVADGTVQRYRRQGIDPVLTRLPFAPRWVEAAPKATAIQAIDAQRWIWLLDGTARQVVQVARDGREIARYALPARLPEPSAFFVSEGQQIAYTIHGSKVVATSVAR
ncbi:MAG: hypothetical protein A2082_02215 [Chloroflexi bacterium GWC2_70_10]|nr:MAG: hypothetical protein A2082_02215 [Chloroflexi bacterium GWC2_70_10]